MFKDTSKIINLRFVFLFLFLLFAHSAQAQDKSFRIIFLNGPQRGFEKCFLFDGKASQEVELPRYNLSPVYKIVADAKQLILTPSAIKTGEKASEKMPSLRLPESSKEFYLIVEQDSERNEFPLRLSYVDANYDRFGQGEMLWVNMTQKALSGKIGEYDFALPSEQMKVVKKTMNKIGSYPVQINYSVPQDDRIHQLIENSWRHDPRSRSLVLVYDEGNRRAPRIRSFSDFRSDLKK